MESAGGTCTASQDALAFAGNARDPASSVGTVLRWKGSASVLQPCMPETSCTPSVLFNSDGSSLTGGTDPARSVPGRSDPGTSPLVTPAPPDCQGSACSGSHNATPRSILRSQSGCGGRSAQASPARRVVFAADVKANDGMRPHSLVFDRLILKCLEIGGMASCEELIAFLAKTAEAYGDFRLYYSDVEALVCDLSARLAACPDGVPILAQGGGSNAKISAAAVPNVDHLKLVLAETKRRMVLVGVFPLRVPTAPAVPAASATTPTTGPVLSLTSTSEAGSSGSTPAPSRVSDVSVLEDIDLDLDVTDANPSPRFMLTSPRARSPHGDDCRTHARRDSGDDLESLLSGTRSPPVAVCEY